MLREFLRVTLRAVRLRRPSLPTLVIAVLLVLLPALALLQYRWVGQVREADRERMQTHVRNAALQFREALDGEIARAVINLQVGVATARDGFSDRYSDRYDAWLTTAGHPLLVANVLLIDADDERVRLRRWNQTTHAFESFDWPGTMQTWRSQLQEELTALRENQPIDRRGPATLDDSLIVTPLRPAPAPPPGTPGVDVDDPPEPPFGFTVVQLDIDYVRTTLLPELAQRYFMLSDGDGYRVAVTSALDAGTVIYKSDTNAPADPALADASEPLFGVRGDFFFFGRGGGNGRGDNRRTVIVNRPRDDGRGGPPGRGGRDFGRWLLLVQHESGSLDAAVTRTRNRNLGVSFGILLLLSVSVGMLAVTSRRAQRLAQQQIEFVAGVSHELRTPIAVIRSAAENLAEGVVGSPERVKRYGDAIGSEARRLGETVEHVIQYAGLESGRDVAGQTALAPATLVEEALAEATSIIRQAGITVHRQLADDLPTIVGDPVALRSAVQNLIANGVKYGGADHWLSVRVDRTREGRHDQVRIVVEDHGAGISAEDLPHIFEPFYRGADVIGRQIHGNGLGLSIVKRIVSAHGGRVSVITRPDAGSTFTITLPGTSSAVRAAAATGSPLPAPGDARAHS